MKKIILMFLSFIVSFYLLVSFFVPDVYGYAEQTCGTTIEVISDDEFLINYLPDLQYICELTDFTTYKVVYNGKVVSSFLISDDVVIIIPQSLTEDMFIAKVILNDFEKLAITNINSYVFNFLLTDSVEIEFGTEMSSYLLELTNRFEMMYYDSDSIDEVSNFQPFTFERNSKTIEQLSSTDAFLDGYKVDYSYGYSTSVKWIHDPIINLIPESWFYQTGTRCHVGEEYAVYVKTIHVINHLFPQLTTYTTDVSIFNIEVSLPMYAKAPGSQHLDQFTYSKDYIFTIEPVVQASYYAYDKNATGINLWSTYFDSSEEKIIVPREDTKPNTFVAPMNNTTQIDYGNDIEYSEYGKNSFGIGGYAYDFESSLSSSYITSFFNTQKIVGLKLNTISAVLSLFVPTKYFAFIPKLAGTTINQQFDEKLKDLERWDEKANEDYDFFVNNSGQQTKLVPGTSILYTPYPYANSVKFPAYNDIFSSQGIGHHKHKIVISLEQRNAPADSDFFAIHNFMQFEFYTKWGKIMVKDSNGSDIVLSASRMYSYEKMVHTTNADPIRLDLSSLSKVIITGSTPAKNICFKSANTGKARLVLTPNGATNGCIINIYDQEGKLIRKIDSYNSDQKQLLLNVTADKFYMFVVTYKNGRSGELSFSFGVPKYREVQNTPLFINWSSPLEKFDMYKLTFRYSGTYLITADSYNDTTMRLYNSQGQLVYESFDPHYDPYEDTPVLYAQFQLRILYGDPNDFYLEVDTENSGPANYTKVALL